MYTQQGGWLGWVGEGAPALGQWSHVAVVYDGQTLRTYLNGALANHAGSTVADPVSGVVYHSGSPLYIGGNGGGNQFYGLIDEVLVSGVDRYGGVSFTPAPRHAPVPQDELLLHFDEGPLSRAAGDSTGHNLSANFNGAADVALHGAGSLTCPAVIEDVQPRVSGAGSTVVLSGAGFGASRGASAVDFAGAVASVYPAWSDASASVTLSANAARGTVSLTRAGTVTPSPVPLSTTPCAGFSAQLPYNQNCAATGWFAASDTTSLTGGPAVTIEAWVKPTTTTNAEQDVVRKESQYLLALLNDRLVAQVYTTAGWSGWAGTSGPLLTAGVWHHLAFTWGSNVLTTYVDGVQGTPFAVTNCSGTGCYLYHSGSPLYVGGNGGGNQFYGELDELRVSNVARYASTFTSPSPRPSFAPDSSTTALWHFNDAEYGNTAADATTNNNTLTAISAAQLGPSTAPLSCN